MTQTVLANTSERLYPQIERLTLNDKSVLILSISESPLKPHLAYGRAYKRVGASTVVMDQGHYHLLLGQKRNGGGADRDVCPEAQISDLDLEKLGRFVALANEKRNTNISVMADPTQILESLELLQGGALTKGAVLLFGKQPQKFLPNSEFRAALFQDNKREQFLAQAIFTGTLFDQLEGVLQFAKQYLPLRIDTGVAGDRTNRLFPISAIRELVANSLVHRDYRDSSSSYFNIENAHSIEITNPGILLAPKITPETMHLPHPSIPINRRLARCFFLAGLIEQWGEGTRRVYQQLSEAGLSAPRWESERGIVRVLVRTDQE